MTAQTAFTAGPFTYQRLGRGLTLNGQACHRWTLAYAGEVLAERTLADRLSRVAVREAFADDRAAFEQGARAAYRPERLQLLDEARGVVLAEVVVQRWPEGMSAGLPNDSARLWLVTATKPTFSRPITLAQFAALGELPAKAWVAGLLPDEVLTVDAEEWRAPTPWELRHVVGEASLTGVTGDQAAALVGLSPQSLRKCMAGDEAKQRHAISFAHWHLLLQRLGVLPAPTVTRNA